MKQIKSKCLWVVLILGSFTSFPMRLSANAYSPQSENLYPSNVYWGDTHVHTNLSVDANLFGNTALGPDEAYRFARGEKIIAHNGMALHLKRPLDFIVIADHAYNMGVLDSLRNADPLLLASQSGQALFQEFQSCFIEFGETDKGKANGLIPKLMGKKVIDDPRYLSRVWERVAEKADAYNQPGVFSAFTGYEWTSLGIKPGGNLHRVVIFRDSANITTQYQPISMLDSPDPEDLWQTFETFSQTTGGGVLAIPHNGNVSNGEMFLPTRFDGSPITQSYAETRHRWEPLYEVTQTKGDGEAHPALSPTDNFADYETWDNWDGKSDGSGQTGTDRQQKVYEYARSGLKLGLQQADSLGVNPFKFGMIGSSDSHTSLAAVEENNFLGKVSQNEPHPSRLIQPVIKGWKPNLLGWQIAASGYAAVWAEENTRESLFAAMKRKEVYASTGPRINVRFFGGWDYKKSDAFRPDLARIGYDKGVPMGGDLTQPPIEKAPTFLIRAVKDPEGANLDRVQVIKGWQDADGALHEKIYNVALSNGRQDLGTQTKKVGNTVNIPDASYTNTIGSSELAVVWTDPAFNPKEAAFYYLRVLEIPTPRWTAYDAKYFRLKNLPSEVPMISQERAYSSPIWYTP